MDGYRLYDYWSILYQRRTTVYLTVLFAVITSAILSLVLPRVYQAQAVFFVPSKPDSLTFFSGVGSAQVTRALVIPDSLPNHQKAYVGILEGATLREKVHAAFPQRTMKQLARNVDFKSGSDFLLRVYVRDRDPRLATEIANTYVRVFNALLNGYSLKTTVDNRAAMEKQLTDTREKLAAARGELTRFQVEHKVARVIEESNNLTKLKTDLEQTLRDTSVKVQETNKQLESVREQFSKESDVYVKSPTAVTSPLVETLERQLSDLEGQIAGARVQYSEKHPTVSSLRAQYDRKKSDLTGEINRLLKSSVKTPTVFLENLRRQLVELQVQREALKARTTGLQKSMENVEAQITALPQIQEKYQVLNRQVEQYQKLIENLQTALEEAAAQERRTLENVVIADFATPPEQAAFPNLFLNVLVALGLGLVGGVFYAYFIDYVDHFKLHLQEDVMEFKRQYVEKEYV